VAFTIDIPNRRLITDALINTIQEINDAARDFEDTQDVVVLDNIAGETRDGIIATSGKDDLGAGVFGPVVLRLVNNWRMYYAPQAGPTWTDVAVVGGTLIATNEYGDKAYESSAFVNWTIPVAQAGAILNIEEITDLWTRMFGGEFYANPTTGKEVLKDAQGNAYSEADAYSDDGNTAYDGTAGIARRDPHVKP
jgi:hypothetical protein